LRFPLKKAKKSLKQWWDFSHKKGLQPWSDLLKFKAEISLQQRLHFSDTKALQLWSIFPLNSSQKLFKNGWISQIKKDCKYG